MLHCSRFGHFWSVVPSFVPSYGRQGLSKQLCRKDNEIWGTVFPHSGKDKDWICFLLSLLAHDRAGIPPWIILSTFSLFWPSFSPRRQWNRWIHCCMMLSSTLFLVTAGENGNRTFLMWATLGRCLLSSSLKYAKGPGLDWHRVSSMDSCFIGPFKVPSVHVKSELKVLRKSSLIHWWNNQAAGLCKEGRVHLQRQL